MGWLSLSAIVLVLLVAALVCFLTLWGARIEFIHKNKRYLKPHFKCNWIITTFPTRNPYVRSNPIR